METTRCKGRILDKVVPVWIVISVLIAESHARTVSVPKMRRNPKTRRNPESMKENLKDKWTHIDYEAGFMEMRDLWQDLRQCV